MSTTWRENYSFPRIFKGRRERTGHCKSAVLCQPLNPSSGQTDFRVMGCQEEKSTLPKAPADVSEFSYVTVESPHPGAGLLTVFPFDGCRTNAYFKTESAYLLGSTNPCPTAVHMELLPTSVLKVLI